MPVRERTELIQNFVVGELAAGGQDLARQIAQQFGISRQAANRHLREMEECGLVRSDGRTRAKTFSLVPTRAKSWEYAAAGLREDEAWDEGVGPFLRGLPQNVFDSFLYGVTEILNNAIDHSESERVEVSAAETAATATVVVRDRGVGIFAKLARDRGLSDPRHAILELGKGKLTTDPQRHSGQGIFFTSRLMDRFAIRSGRLSFRHVRPEEDWLTEELGDPVEGTTVEMTLRRESDVSLQAVFDRFARPEEDDYAFSRTHVPVVLAQFDELLVSRSQAKRVLSRIEQFKEVAFDFKGIDFVGQAFADEIFRVFVNAHPEVDVRHRNAGPRVLGMIRRAQEGNDAAGQARLFES